MATESWTNVADPSRDSVLALSLLSGRAGAGTTDTASADTLRVFDRCAPQLLRYVASFGLGPEETEDIVQEVFLAFFRHVRLGRDHTNTTGWLFQVAHHLALKQRQRLRRRLAVHDAWDQTLIDHRVDPDPNAEAQLVRLERQRRLRSVVRALPDRDRRCVLLRAEGLTYRDIAAVLRVSLGAVAKSLTRAMTRLLNADGG
jgi:RNA polymerase sigma-70 factor (ECF subfamily)